MVTLLLQPPPENILVIKISPSHKQANMKLSVQLGHIMVKSLSFFDVIIKSRKVLVH